MRGDCKKICLIMWIILSLTACTGPAEETGARIGEDSAGGSLFEENTAKEENKGGIHKTKDGEFYTFQDVEGRSYEALLLEDVPQCSYDFSCLTTDQATGYKSYNDEREGVTARRGIDVSEFQGEEIDWEQVRESGVEFAIIRLGYRAYGESGDLVMDAMFEKNIKGALEAGLDVGVYFFSQAVSEVEALEEAEFVLKHLKPYEIDGPVVYDTEEIKWDTARTDQNTRQEFTDYCRVFCDAVEHAGYDSMIYSNMKWMAFTLDMEQLSEYDFWYADYAQIPQCPYDYKIWQYSESGEVPGISGNVDLNLWFEKENGNRQEGEEK